MKAEVHRTVGVCGDVLQTGLKRFTLVTYVIVVLRAEIIPSGTQTLFELATVIA
jgi:hypothetical protein